MKHKIFPYSVPQIEDKYYEWVSEDNYMILQRIELRTNKSEIIAIKSSKRGNDVYRHRVYRRFKDFVSLA